MELTNWKKKTNTLKFIKMKDFNHTTIKHFDEVKIKHHFYFSIIASHAQLHLKIWSFPCSESPLLSLVGWLGMLSSVIVVPSFLPVRRVIILDSITRQ